MWTAFRLLFELDEKKRFVLFFSFVHAENWSSHWCSKWSSRLCYSRFQFTLASRWNTRCVRTFRETWHRASSLRTIYLPITTVRLFICLFFTLLERRSFVCVSLLRTWPAGRDNYCACVCHLGSCAQEAFRHQTCRSLDTVRVQDFFRKSLRSSQYCLVTKKK